MDTIEIKDTIIILVRDTVSQSDMIEAYQDLLKSQQSTYTALIIAILGIFTTIIAATIWYQYRLNRGLIISRIRTIFNKDKENIIDEIKKSFDQRFLLLVAESSRNSMLQCLEVTKGSIIAHFFTWCSTSLEANKRINRGGGSYKRCYFTYRKNKVNE